MTDRKPGRPKGSATVEDEVLVQPSRCKQCGSSRRTKYEGTTRVPFTGNDGCVEIVRRRCKCSDCGRCRIDREPVYAPAVT
jgi:hypothetical protein